MKGMIVRICAWFTMIIYSLTSVVGLIPILVKEFTVAGMLAVIMFLVMSVTGWHARNFGLPRFRTYPFSIMTALVSLIMGLAFIILAPILLASFFGFEDSWLAIRNLVILFFPVVVSAVAILSSSRRNQAA
jgi:hypothetical protein